MPPKGTEADLRELARLDTEKYKQRQIDNRKRLEDLEELEVLQSRGDVIFKTWMFCPITGSLLILDAASGVARSQYTDFERPLEELDDTMSVVTYTDMEYYRRQYHLEPVIKSDELLAFEELLKHRVRATVEEPCPKCKNPVLDYYTMQLRSADEGQTVFYECRKCDYRYATNN